MSLFLLQEETFLLLATYSISISRGFMLQTFQRVFCFVHWLWLIAVLVPLCAFPAP